MARRLKSLESRLVLDEPMDLPEGAEVELIAREGTSAVRRVPRLTHILEGVRMGVG